MRTARSVRPGRVAVAILCCASLAACANSGQADEQDKARPKATATADVRDLVETATTSGNLEYAAAGPLNATVAGTVTSLPKKGATIKEGQVLYSIDTRPTVRLDGTLPAWRLLGPGVADGKDVEQLEQGLTDLGYGGGLTVDDEWTSATTAAVKRWQKALDVKQTGSVGLGDVVFSPRDLRIDSLTARKGSTVAPGTPVLEAGTTEQIVTTTLSSNVKIAVAVGDSVDLVLADGSQAKGKVRSVTDETGADGSASRSVTIGLTGASPATGAGSSSVKATFTDVIATDALVVPVAALIALSGGGYGVQKVAADGSTSYVTVTPGKFADTDVAVTSDELKAGDTVGVAP